jgi:hypothetical protein
MYGGQFLLVNFVELDLFEEYFGVVVFSAEAGNESVSVGLDDGHEDDIHEADEDDAHRAEEFGVGVDAQHYECTDQAGLHHL